MMKYALVLLCLLGTAAAGPISNECKTAGTFKRYVFVQNNQQLLAAVADAQAGDLIELRPRNYTTAITINKSGTDKSPIVLCGSPTAKIQGGFQGPAVNIKGSYVVLIGLALARSKIGVLVDGNGPVKLEKLLIIRIANQGIYLKNTNGAIIDGTRIHRVGIKDNAKGQGIYIDNSRNTQVIDNNFIGRVVPAEMIYVSEGSDSGLIKDNVFQGQDISGRSGADSWVDIRANGYTVTGNTGFATPKDGFRVSGKNNKFESNTCYLSWNSAGVCINVDCDAACQKTNVVACSNTVIPGASSPNRKELTNIKTNC